MRRPRVVASETIYQGRVIRLVRETLKVEGRRIVRDTVLHPGAVVIVYFLKTRMSIPNS